MNTKFYFDDEEEGLSPQTSHPKFNEIISDYFYFDCMDEFSPFGNDEGAEILYALQDWYKPTFPTPFVKNMIFTKYC